MSFNAAVNSLSPPPDFDGALFNFRIFLKLGAPTCMGPGASCPPLGGPDRNRILITRPDLR